MGLCLLADTAAVESMNSDLPWVYALDMRFDHSSEIEEGEYPGYFRVAVDSVIPELYPMLSAGMTPPEIWFPGIKCGSRPFNRSLCFCKLNTDMLSVFS